MKPYECRNTKGSFRCDRPRYTTTTSTTTTTARTTAATSMTTTKRPYIQTFYTPTQVYTQAFSNRYNVWPQYATTVPNRINVEYDQRFGPCNDGFQRNSQGACSGSIISWIHS